MPCVAFSISRPITSGINFVVSCESVQLDASRWMISTIFLRMARIWEEAAYVVFFTWLGRRLVNAMANRRIRYSSVVLTTTLASISVCHLRTRDRSLSEVKSRPWKLVRQFLPCTSSTRSFTFRNAWSSSFCRSASETSNILPFSASLAFLRPVVRLTRVFPTLKELVRVAESGNRGILLSNLECRWGLSKVRRRVLLLFFFPYLYIIPIFSGEGVLCSLLQAFFAFRESLIPKHS